MLANSVTRWFGIIKRMRVLAGVAAWVMASAAGAQTSPIQIAPERVSGITVTPAVADTGVARDIRISGTWPGCPPVGARITSATGSQPGTRVARLILPQTLLPCAAALSYSITTTFTPAARGAVNLLVLNVDGEFLGETVVDTRAPDDNHSASNLTGMWYDPLSNGSGLTFVHSRANDNAVFGTWYLYDSTGKPRWYTIQNVEWKSQGRVMEGTLFEIYSLAATCPPPFIACPVRSGPLMMGTDWRARVTLTGANSARVEALTRAGAVIFASDIMRVDI